MAQTKKRTIAAHIFIFLISMENARRKMLGLYRQVAYTTMNEYPDGNTGRNELRRIRNWVRRDLDWDSLNSLKKSSGILRYSLKELQRWISFAKYRTMRRRYD